MISPNAINTHPKLKARSKFLYIDYVTRIASQLYQGDYAKLVDNPDATYQYLTKLYKTGYATIGLYMTAIYSMIQLHPEHPISESIMKKWREYRTLMRKLRMDQYLKNELSEREKSRTVRFKDLKSRFCQIQGLASTHSTKRKHLNYVLFAMFLHIKPKRADLGNVYIGATVADIPITYRSEGNYIVLDNTPRLVMGNYKTSERYGRIVEPLNAELVKILKDSLVKYPRDHLFEHSRKALPYKKNNSYSQFVKRAFDDTFGKSMGASLWRRVYVAENVDFKGTANEVLIANARLSGQSLITQLMIYKNINDLTLKKKEDITKVVKCPEKPKSSTVGKAFAHKRS